VAVVADVVVVAAIGLIVDAVAKAGLTAYAVSAVVLTETPLQPTRHECL
jgi:hypothetical protein